jgi:hypothetical protein
MERTRRTIEEARKGMLDAPVNVITPEAKHLTPVRELLSATAARFCVLACDASDSHLKARVSNVKIRLKIFTTRNPRTIGNRAPQISTRENDRINPIFAEMFSCVHASKLSAQSPA